VSVKRRSIRRASAAAGVAILSCLAVPALAQAPAGNAAPANAAQQTDQQQIRDEVDRLRKRPAGKCKADGEKNRCTPLTLH